MRAYVTGEDFIGFFVCIQWGRVVVCVDQSHEVGKRVERFMRIFTGQFERTIDAKNRIQLPSQLRAIIDPEQDGEGLYISLGEHRGTLSIFTERAFEELASRWWDPHSEFKPLHEINPLPWTTSIIT